MAQPALAIALALSTRPTEAPTWIDVTASTQGVPHIRRGRPHDLAEMEPGSGCVELDNRDRRFDPAYAAGPYYGNLKPMRRIKIKASWDGVTYDLFTGYVDGWPPEFSVGDGWVKVEAHDGFKCLGRCELNTSFAQQLSSERIDAVLNAVSWTTGAAWVLDSLTNSQLDATTMLGPVGDRLIMIGNTTVQADVLENANALQHLHEVAQAENGLLFMGRDGAVIFQNRHYRLAPEQMTPRWTFGDDLTSELPYVDAKLSYDDSDVYNDVRMTRRDGTTQAVMDSASQLDYFPITLTQDRLLAASDLEMLDRAFWLLGQKKQPRWRITSLRLDPEGDDRLWPVVLQAELGDRIRVRQRPFGGALVEGEYHIKHIEINISEDFRWSVEWQLSPADMTKYWHVSDGGDEFADYAILGTTTVLSY